jgi:hypothetical protein
MPILLTLEDRIRHRFRSKKRGINTNWYPMDCRTAEKFLKKEGLDVRTPRPGYETIVKRERDVRTVLVNRGGKCEFMFYYGRPVGEILDGARRRRRRSR